MVGKSPKDRVVHGLYMGGPILTNYVDPSWDDPNQVGTPPKSKIDTKKDGPLEYVSPASKRHFGYLC